MANVVSFLFPRRVARLSYVLRSIAISLAVLPAIDRYENGSPASDDLEGLWLALIVAACAYTMIFIVLPRCRDLDAGWGMALLCLVPVANVFVAWGLLFARSHPEIPKIDADGVGAPGSPWAQSDAKVGMKSEKTAEPGATDNPGGAQ